ncbi:MAG: calcium-binding protein [Actinomycetia bacterium]|nr:calcium-binding protein [Actinomycetes bacterium]
MKPEVVAGPAELGEGPTWDPAASRLLWVDVLGCEVRAYDPATGTDALLTATEQHVGAAKPRTGGGLVVNLRDGIGLYEPDGSFSWLVDLSSEGCRGNDAAIDAAGNLWAGTMRYDEAPGGGALYRITPDGEVVTVLDDVTVSNGTGWSPDGRLMYYVDSPTRLVDVFDTDPDTGLVTGRRTFVDLNSEAPALPDGLTVDADGCVWVALWDGGSVRRYTPDGALDRVIEFPAIRTTACAFGGPDLRDLYVTSARVGLPPGSPSAGSLFVIPDAGQGLPAYSFG